MKKLPIASSPIHSYLHEGHTFNILYNNKKLIPWIYTNFIQLRLTDILMTYMPYNVFTGMPIFKHQHIFRELLITYNIDIIDFIKNAIDNNNYVALYLNEEYLVYTKYNIACHNAFVYGYDENEKKFYMMSFDCNKNDLYGEVTCTFEEMQNAYAETYLPINNMTTNTISLIQLDNFQKYDLNLYVMRDWLYEYLYSRNCESKASYMHIQDFSFASVWGRDCYLELIHRIEKNGYISFRTTYALWEHKKIMLERIEYLIQYKYIPNCDDIVNKYKPIVHLCENLKNAMMISIRKQEDPDYIYIIKKLKYIYDEEFIVLSQLLRKIDESLSAYINSNKNEIEFDTFIPVKKQMRDNDWVRFNNVWINDEYNKTARKIHAFYFMVSDIQQPGSIKVYIDSLDGELIASTKVSEDSEIILATNKYISPYEYELNITEDKHNLFVVTEGEFTINEIFVQSLFHHETNKAEQKLCIEKDKNPIDIFSVNYGVDYDINYGNKYQKIAFDYYNVSHMIPGSYVGFYGVDFYKDTHKVIMTTSSKLDDCYIEIKVNGVDGTAIGQCKVPNTNDYYEFVTIECDVANIHGKHDLYFCFNGPHNSLFNFYSFRFQ